MGKGELRIKKTKAEEEVIFDPRLSQDKKTFVLVIESTCRMSWYEAVQAARVYAVDELERLGRETNTNEH